MLIQSLSPLPRLNLGPHNVLHKHSTSKLYPQLSSYFFFFKTISHKIAQASKYFYSPGRPQTWDLFASTSEVIGITSLCHLARLEKKFFFSTCKKKQLASFKKQDVLYISESLLGFLSGEWIWGFHVGNRKLWGFCKRCQWQGQCWQQPSREVGHSQVYFYARVYRLHSYCEDGVGGTEDSGDIRQTLGKSLWAFKSKEACSIGEGGQEEIQVILDGEVKTRDSDGEPGSHSKAVDWETPQLTG